MTNSIADARSFFRFAYLCHTPPGREARLHQLRDGDAVLFMLSAIRELGYINYGGVLLAWPKRSQPDYRAIPRQDDLIVLATRPTVSDGDEYDRKFVPRSGSALENRIIAVSKQYFDICSRSMVVLNSRYRKRLLPATLNRMTMEFHQHNNASYKKLARLPATPEEGRRTAAFIIRDIGRNPNEPDLLIVFAMGGVETLVWSYLIGTRHIELLKSSSFVFAEFACPWYENKAPMWKPDDLSFADDILVEVLIRETGSRP